MGLIAKKLHLKQRVVRKYLQKKKVSEKELASYTIFRLNGLNFVLCLFFF